MTLQDNITSLPASPDSSDQLAENLVGFSDSAPAEAQTPASTTLFISAPSGFSNGCMSATGVSASSWKPRS